MVQDSGYIMLGFLENIGGQDVVVMVCVVVVLVDISVVDGQIVIINVFVIYNFGSVWQGFIIFIVNFVNIYLFLVSFLLYFLKNLEMFFCLVI